MAASTTLIANTWAGLCGLAAPRFIAWAAIGLVLDAVVGDPVFALHPIRLLHDLVHLAQTQGGDRPSIAPIVTNRALN